MEPILMLFVHVLVLVLVFALLYWIVTLVTGLLPPPIAGTVRVILLVLLALLAIAVLCGDLGVWGDWGTFRVRRHG
jgi:hypothetical protein